MKLTPYPNDTGFMIEDDDKVIGEIIKIDHGKVVNPSYKSMIVDFPDSFWRVRKMQERTLFKSGRFIPIGFAKTKQEAVDMVANSIKIPSWRNLWLLLDNQ